MRVQRVRAEPFDVALTTPFGIATGAQDVARNVLVHLELDDGTIGLGEAAPFPAVSGETQAQTLEAITSMASVVSGQDPRRWRRIASQLRRLAPAARAARCALETALLDALCRHCGWSLWSFFGGAERELKTDITIVTGTPEAARSAAREAAEGGFEILKVKIGGVAQPTDLARLLAIADAAPRCRLILDANAALTADAALALLAALGDLRGRVVLFEQPTAPDDLAGMRRVREHGGVPIAADESATDARAVAELARERAADVVNLKLSKSGIAEALDMAATARALGLGLMIGGMVETEICMTTSACLAAGLGGFSFVDLDTPLFLAPRPLAGGFAQEGPRLSLAGSGPGHGVSLLPRPPA